MRGAWRYVVLTVIIPTAKEMLAEAGSRHREDDLRRPSSSTRRAPNGVLGHGVQPFHRARQTRRPAANADDLVEDVEARQSFDEIIIPSRQEAEEVLDRMFDLVSKYDSATVADLYELTGLNSSHTDHKWGWTDLRDASVGRVRGGGYLLNLPEPQSLE
jgi:hypothetical protein